MRDINNALTAQFDKIFIINLAHRQDRRDEMQDELQKIGLSLQHPQVALFTAVKPDSPAEWPSIGARGCFMSHLGILQLAQQAGYSRILILEDDLNFVSGFNQKFSGVFNHVNQANPNWEIFYGGYDLDVPLAQAQEGYVEIAASQGVRTTHFVAFGAKALNEVVKFLTEMAARPAGDPNGGPMHVDGAYSWFRKAYPHYKTIAANPQLGYQRSSLTDIHTLGWKDSLPVIRHLVGWSRKLKNFLRSTFG